MHKPNESFAEMLHTPIPRVLVAVCTYKRPKMLRACLESLLSMQPNLSFQHDILVVDNDFERSGHMPFCKAEMTAYRVQMIYLSEAIRGIARARNRCIDYALACNYNYIAFLDDDETAHPNWLSELMKPIWKGKPIIYGRQIMTFQNIPAWAVPQKEKRIRANGSLCAGATHNVRIAREVFEKLRFNEQLGLAGGEDGEFFARAKKAGYLARFAAEAITYEAAHPERMTFSGQLNRAYWVGASGMREAIIVRGRNMKFKKLPSIITGPVIAAGYGLAGLAAYGLNRNLGLHLMLKGGKHAAKQWGRVAALRGHLPQSYAKTVGA